jgi:PAS domain S-box-containing protein
MIAADMNATRFALAARASIVCALVFITGAMGLALPSLGGRIPLLLLPSGVAVGAVYRWGNPMAAAVLAAGIAIDLWAGRPLLAACCTGAALALGALLATRLLARYRFDPQFGCSRDAAVFIGCAAVAMVPASVLGMLGQWAGGVLPSTDAEHWVRWWSNLTAGVLLLAPILLAANRNSLARFAAASWWGRGLWLFGVVFCCGAILVGPGAIARPLIVVLANLLIVVGALRFGLVVTASAALGISLTTAFSFLFERGVFGGFSVLQGLVTIWAFTLALTGLCLIITALLGERDAASLEKLRAEHRYAEVFNGSPHAMWVHNRDTGAFLLVNEAAIRRYGWSREEFLARRVEDLVPPGQARILPEPIDADAADAGALAAAAEPLETHHRTREGQLFDVEVWTRSINLAGVPATLVFAVDVTERRAFGRALIDASAREQRRIGQEMHDGLGQELTGLALTARALATRARREWPSRAADLEEVAALATTCIQGARRIVQGLAPISDADGSLEAALAGLARRSSLSGLRVDYRGSIAIPLLIGLDTRNHLYRIAQEAVQNALKHAGAKSIEIILDSQPATLRLSILDDGLGVAEDRARSLGLGMRTMRFRANSIGARIVIGPRNGGGFAVVCELASIQERRMPA